MPGAKPVSGRLFVGGGSGQLIQGAAHGQAAIEDAPFGKLRAGDVATVAVQQRRDLCGGRQVTGGSTAMAAQF